jgi:light-regulated signal transduction histidine kinase (bacteriophytochrome)
MTPDTLTHVFDRFWRAEGSRTLPGHGLGLALVKQIFDAHHGSITIESVTGVGTTVRILADELIRSRRRLPPELIDEQHGGLSDRREGHRRTDE